MVKGRCLDMYRRTWMEVDLDAIEYNVKKIKDICKKKVICVIKADAYGCGDIEVAKACLNAGASMLAVSSVDEAVMLRNQGYDGEILILGATDAKDADVLIEKGISCAAYSMDWVKSEIEHGCKGLSVHLKVDTGMSRIGFKDLDELNKAKNMLLEAGAKLDGIFTHFCCTDSSMEMTNKQFARFEEAVKYVDYPFKWVHCDNSDATIFFKDDLSNACRVGISLYGVSQYDKDLKHPISLYSEISMIKEVEKGNVVGYGATYTVEEDKEWIATMPIGYADGFVRKNQGRNVYVNGKYVPVVGRVCMDQTMMHLENYEPVGTKVEIFGKHIALEEMAEDLDTITYEIICLITPRVTRVYTRSGKVVKESNLRLKGSLQ